MKKQGARTHALTEVAELHVSAFQAVEHRRANGGGHGAANKHILHHCGVCIAQNYALLAPRAPCARLAIRERRL